MPVIKTQVIILSLCLLAIAATFVISKAYNIELFEGSENFENKGKSVILYYAPWCGHCKAMMPQWNKFEEAGVKGVNIKKINAEENKAAASAANVSGFPTIIKYNNGKKEIYKGERTAEALKSWARV